MIVLPPIARIFDYIAIILPSERSSSSGCRSGGPKGLRKNFHGQGNKRMFPIFEKTMEQQLRKETATPILTTP
jgi:hypothetical protein